MPNPVAAPPARNAETAANLDELVRQAMAGNVDVKAFRAALGNPPAVGGGPAAVPPPPRPGPAPGRSGPRPVKRNDDLDDMHTLLSSARSRWEQGDDLGAAGLLRRLADRAGALASRLVPEEVDDVPELPPEALAPTATVAPVDPSPLRLSARPAGATRPRLRLHADLAPPKQEEEPVDDPDTTSPTRSEGGQDPGAAVATAPHSAVEPAPARFRLAASRHPFALVMAEPQAGTETASLAAALGVDLATARVAAIAGGTRIVMRSADREDLLARAARLHALGVAACVVDRRELLAESPARCVTSVESTDVVRVVDSPLWASAPDPGNLPRGEPLVLAAPGLLLVGEVEERRLRANPEDSRWQRHHYAAAKGAGGESRRLVLDLHAAGTVLRLVEGTCDLSAFHPGSSRLALKELQDRLVARWPELLVEPRRVCPAVAVPGEALREDGWGTWEEHSRACRALRA